MHPDPHPKAGSSAWRRTVAYLRIDAPRANRLIDAFRNHRGALSPAVAILAVMIFTLAGLVIDGGRQLGAKSRAVGYAQEAARVGAATIDLNDPEAKIDTAKATTAVAAFCAQVTSNDPAVTQCATTKMSPEALTVQVTITNKTSFLGMIGIKSLDARGAGEAHSEQGVKKPDDKPHIPALSVIPTLDGPGSILTSDVPPPTFDVPCPTDWTIATPPTTPPWTLPVPMPASCTPSITPTPTPTDTETSTDPSAPPGSSSKPPGG
jgi:Flp pilus assembly protein TadG